MRDTKHSSENWPTLASNQVERSVLNLSVSSFVVDLTTREKWEQEMRSPTVPKSGAKIRFRTLKHERDQNLRLWVWTAANLDKTRIRS